MVKLFNAVRLHQSQMKKETKEPEPVKEMLPVTEVRAKAHMQRPQPKKEESEFGEALLEESQSGSGDE